MAGSCFSLHEYLYLSKALRTFTAYCFQIVDALILVAPPTTGFALSTMMGGIETGGGDHC